MEDFVKLDNAFVHLVSRGVTKSVGVYLLGDRIYAKHGSGFIRLRGRKSTSVPSIHWRTLYIEDGEVDFELFDMRYKTPTKKSVRIV